MAAQVYTALVDHRRFCSTDPDPVFISSCSPSSSFYKEALDNVVSYNAQAMRERRSRLPYVDAQTGIAQADSFNWKKRSERQWGILPGTGFWCALIRDESPAAELKKFIAPGLFMCVSKLDL